MVQVAKGKLSRDQVSPIRSQRSQILHQSPRPMVRSDQTKPTSNPAHHRNHPKPPQYPQSKTTPKPSILLLRPFFTHLDLYSLHFQHITPSPSLTGQQPHSLLQSIPSHHSDLCSSLTHSPPIHYLNSRTPDFLSLLANLDKPS